MAFCQDAMDPPCQDDWFESQQTDLYHEASNFFDKISSPKYSRIIGKVICEAYLSGESDDAESIIEGLGWLDISHVYAYMDMNKELEEYLREKQEDAMVRYYAD